MIDRVSFLSLMVSGAATAAVTAAAEPYPLLAIIGCACFAAFMVRLANLTKNLKKKKAWLFEIVVTILIVFLTAISIIELHPSVATGVGYGLGLGGIGTSIIGFARMFGWKVLRSWAESIMAAPPPKD